MAARKRPPRGTGEFRIRRAGPADLAAVAACVAAAYRPYVARIGREPAPMLADYAALLEAGRVQLLETETRLAGVLVLFARADHVFVETLAVDPRAQGRGLGRHLMAFAEDWAQYRGLAKIRLYTNVHMREAAAFYTRLGYRETGRVREQGYARIYFEKALAQSD